MTSAVEPPAPAVAPAPNPARTAAPAPLSAAEIDAAVRAPVFLLVTGAVKWLVLGAALTLVGSLKFHVPALLSGWAWTTYGRIAPAASSAFIYGFAIPGALAVMLWILARLGRGPVTQPGLLTLAAGFWHVGVAVGLVGILAGQSTGFEGLEMPGVAAPILCGSFALMAGLMLRTLQARRNPETYVAQWHGFAAILWFAWIYSAAAGLLLFGPIRGVGQAVVTWWFLHNLTVVWAGLVGLAILYYFLPRSAGVALHSRQLAMFAFWLTLGAGGLGGIPQGAPVPAWLPAVSTVATVVLAVGFAAVAINVSRTVSGQGAALRRDPAARFLRFAFAAYLGFGLMLLVGALGTTSRFAQFTSFGVAQSRLAWWGFLAMAVFGATYTLFPRVIGVAWPAPNLIGLHYRLSTIGVALTVVPLALGGLAQGRAMADPQIAFMDALRGALMGMRISTLGETLFLAGQVVLLAHLTWMIWRWIRQACCRPGNLEGRA